MFFEEWGELLTKHHCPVPVIFSLETKDCQAVDCDLSVGQVWFLHQRSSSKIFIDFSLRLLINLRHYGDHTTIPLYLLDGTMSQGV